jgi:site-specific recombinase XerD
MIPHILRFAFAQHLLRPGRQEEGAAKLATLDLWVRGATLPF